MLQQVRAFSRVLALTLMVSHVTPVALLATAHPRGNERRGILESVDLYGRDGRIRKHYEGEALSSWVELVARELRKVDSADLAIARDAIAKFRGTSERRMTSLELLSGILEAYSATSDAEYRRRMDNLPVSVVRRVDAKNERGEKGVSVEYWIQGELRARAFVASESGEWSAPSDSEEDARSAESGSTRRETSCEWTDPYDNAYYSGECATQQALDDAYVTAIALEADIYDLDSDVETACAPPENPEVCAISDHMTRAGEAQYDFIRIADAEANYLEAMANANTMVGGFPPNIGLSGGTELACGFPKAAYGIALGNFGVRLLGVFAFAVSGGPAIAAAVVVGGAVVAAAAVVVAGAATIDCVAAQERA
jgi:hypothetical protein